MYIFGTVERKTQL